MGVEKREKILEKKASEATSKIERNSIYFAHPVSSYNTSLERLLIKNLPLIFEGMNIYNPNQPNNQKNYELWKKETGRGMNYYFNVILPDKKIVGGVYLPFEDGMIGAGVYGEMEKLCELKKPIFEIRSRMIVEKINKMDSSRRLSIDETRKRVYHKN